MSPSDRQIQTRLNMTDIGRGVKGEADLKRHRYKERPVQVIKLHKTIKRTDTRES